MKRGLKILIILALMLGVFLPAAAKGPNLEVGSIDVIILTEGSPAALAAEIEGLGGTVSFQYKNVNALAASIPADKLTEIAKFSDILTIEQDQMVYLADGHDVGQLTGEVRLVKGFDAGLRRLVDDAADLQADAVPGLEEVPRRQYLDGEVVDLPGRQPLGIGVGVIRLVRC